MSVNPKECEIYILKDLDSDCAAKLRAATWVPSRINF